MLFRSWRFGISAIICILHDVLFLIAFYGLFHLQVNNPFIAALLTVIGYSINDTIVVFDRIRENLSLNLKWGLSDLAITYHQLGILAHDQNDYDTARNRYEQSLHIKEELGDRAGMASSWRFRH